MAQVGELASYLVMAPRFQLDLQEGVVVQGLDDAVVEDGLLGLWALGDETLVLFGIAKEVVD